MSEENKLPGNNTSKDDVLVIGREIASDSNPSSIITGIYERVNATTKSKPLTEYIAR